VGPWLCEYGPGNRPTRYFWPSDINSTSQKLAEYERNIKLHRPGAKQALKDFKVQQIELLTSISDVSPVTLTMVELC
jgi:hypothetical protein